MCCQAFCETIFYFFLPIHCKGFGFWAWLRHPLADASYFQEGVFFWGTPVAFWVLKLPRMGRIAQWFKMMGAYLE